MFEKTPTAFTPFRTSRLLSCPPCLIPVHALEGLSKPEMPADKGFRRFV